MSRLRGNNKIKTLFTVKNINVYTWQGFADKRGRRRYSTVVTHALVLLLDLEQLINSQCFAVVEDTHLLLN